jgi:hypothetical protein
MRRAKVHEPDLKVSMDKFNENSHLVCALKLKNAYIVEDMIVTNGAGLVRTWNDVEYVLLAIASQAYEERAPATSFVCLGSRMDTVSCL